MTRAPGYAIEVGPEQLDLSAFRAADRGRPGSARRRRPGDRLGEVGRRARAVARPPLADFAFESFAQAEIARLEELRLAALEDRIAADLELGRHARLVGELEAVVSEHPLRERPRGQLMVALYRCGRQAEALETYRAARRALVEELGLEPSRELRALEQAILTQDSALDAPGGAASGAVARPPLPGRLARSWVASGNWAN